MAPNGARIPPHSLDAEASLVGAMLLSANAIDAAIDCSVTSADFYKPAHGHIYDACIALWRTNAPCDVVTVGDQLKRDGLLDVVGGPATLSELMAGTPAISNAARYARIVRDHAQLRSLLTAAAEIADMAYSGPDDVGAVVDAAEAALTRLTRSSAEADLVAIDDLLRLGLDALDDAQRGDNAGVSWPLDDLNSRVGPIGPGQLAVVGARPAMGKSVVGLQLAVHAAEHGIPALVVSLEMNERDLFERLVAMRGNDATLTALTRARLSPAGWDQVTHATRDLAGLPLSVLCDSAATIPRVRAVARSFARRHRNATTGLLVVDYLQLLAPVPGERAENRQLEVAAQSRSLKQLAGELGWAVVALSQVSRGPEARADKRPTLADLRESGSIESDADLVMFLFRPEIYDEATPDRGLIEIAIAKHRRGAAGGSPVIARFDGAHTRLLQR